MIQIPFEILSMKNSKEIRYRFGKGKKTPFIANRTIVINQKKAIVDYMVVHRDLWEEEIKGKNTPYILCYKLYRKTDGAFDYNNISQIVFDSMEEPNPKKGKIGAKWIKDDNMRNLLPIACGWEKDESNPRMEFYIAADEQKKILEKYIFSLHNKNESNRI